VIYDIRYKAHGALDANVQIVPSLKGAPRECMAMPDQEMAHPVWTPADRGWECLNAGASVE
jgi:hypothetical protein